VARDRSPNYPAIGLPSAIERAENCHSTIGETQVVRAQAARALGYSSLNGSALSAISAELKYGLLTKIGDRYRLTDRAMSILRPKDKREKAQAIWDAASAPAIFVDLMDIFPGLIPEESDVARYLARRGFGEAALKTVSQAFRETFALVSAEAHGYIPPIENVAGKSPLKRITASFGMPLEIAPAQSGAEKMRVTVTETGVEVNATLTTRAGIDRLMRALEATRPLVYETTSQEDSPQGDPGSGQPRSDINNQQSAEAVDAARKAGGT
jgi:hypothetical protein